MAGEARHFVTIMIYLFSSTPKTLLKYFVEQNIPVTLIGKADFDQFLATYKPVDGDLGITYDFGKIIPRELLEKLHLINIHFSLLPKYRGATPVEAAILAGEIRTGITIQKMIDKMDAGPVVLQFPIDIKEGETAGELQSRMDAGLPFLMQLLFEKPVNEWIYSEQTGEPTFCYMKLLNRDNAELRPALMSSSTFINSVRAYNPEPLAWLKVLKNNTETTMNIIRAEKSEITNLKPGEWQFIKKAGLAVGVIDGTILITELVLAGSKVLKGGDIVALKGALTLL